jgi:hypothetical protein
MPDQDFRQTAAGIPMKRLLISALLLVTTTMPLAARPNTLAMSCRQAQSLVASEGAVVMSTGKHTYARFVADAGYCETAEWAHSATAPTKDRKACPLGYICDTAPPIWYDDDGPFGGMWGH